MLLKRLTLVGFKSFADRTRLEFDAGVNVVVGPNGTGKSNILDAIAWVMGTQATRSLRTERMEDVVPYPMPMPSLEDHIPEESEWQLEANPGSAPGRVPQPITD